MDEPEAPASAKAAGNSYSLNPTSYRACPRLYSFNFFNCLTISTVHMMDVNRYRFSQMPMSLISQSFQCLFLFALVFVLVLHWRRNQAKQAVESSVMRTSEKL